METLIIDNGFVIENAPIPTSAAHGCFWSGNMNRWRVGDVSKKPEERGPDWSRLHTRLNNWNNDPAAFSKFRFIE